MQVDGILSEMPSQLFSIQLGLCKRFFFLDGYLYCIKEYPIKNFR